MRWWDHPFIAISTNDNMDVIFYGKFIVKSFKSCLQSQIQKVEKAIFPFKRGFYRSYLAHKCILHLQSTYKCWHTRVTLIFPSIKDFNSFEKIFNGKLLF